MPSRCSRISFAACPSAISAHPSMLRMVFKKMLHDTAVSELGPRRLLPQAMDCWDFISCLIRGRGYLKIKEFLVIPSARVGKAGGGRSWSMAELPLCQRILMTPNDRSQMRRNDSLRPSSDHLYLEHHQGSLRKRLWWESLAPRCAMVHSGLSKMSSVFTDSVFQQN